MNIMRRPFLLADTAPMHMLSYRCSTPKGQVRLTGKTERTLTTTSAERKRKPDSEDNDRLDQVSWLVLHQHEGLFDTLEAMKSVCQQEGDI